ncbi:MAG: hypothetical protein HZC23_07570 [Rhodocyclales bacterium]|nr:hypothetical protein [Rhodocyclales bacterium]
MNKFAMTAIAASLAFATPVFADDAHHPEKGQEAKAAPARPVAKVPEQAVKKMQENVTKMMDQLDRIGKAKTDEERRKATTEHLITMQEQMQMARGMQAGMMGCPMMEGGMMGKGGMGMMGGPQAGGADRMQQMERRMDMMQMMMEHMMHRQEGQPQPMPEGNPRGMK